MKPILFNTEMVWAILDGRKTVTRRVIKPQPTVTDLSFAENRSDIDQPKLEAYKAKIAQNIKEAILRDRKPPYQPGDILYVRETWFEYFLNEKHTEHAGYIYRANIKDGTEFCWRPSIHMPRKAARIFLRVTDVRAERLQSITVDDVIAEGFDADNKICNPDPSTHESIRNWNLEWAHRLFSELWDKLNAKRGYGWDANPWVWVIEFERITKGDAKEKDGHRPSM